MANTIALIAHDSQKEKLLAFVQRYVPVFSRYRLIATEQTGQIVRQATGFDIEVLMTGAKGGDIQIAAEVVSGNVIAVIFLVDPAPLTPIEPGLETILRSCQIHNIPLALNLSTSEFILSGLAQLNSIHLIFNPVAGNGNTEADLALVRELLEPHCNLTVHLTTIEKDADELAREAIASGAHVVIASGGDGTVSAVAGALIGTEIPLGVIPRGTANAFCLALGIPTTIAPIRNCCRIILEQYTRVVDAARCNDRPMILLAGIGFEAELVERANRELKDQWGTLAYLMAGWQQLDEQEIFDVEAEIEGQTHHLQAGAITIANAAPPTSVLAQGIGQVIFDDGLLDVTMVTADSKLQAIRSMIGAFGAALIKTPLEQPNLVHTRLKRIVVKTDPPQKLVVDGEVVGTTPVEVECIPKGLTVLVPKPQGNKTAAEQ
ncbi:MAG: methylglyoxal synthase [Elainellaceae cyanobacterium]